MAARDSLGGLQSKGALGCCCASALPRASQPATRMADSCCRSNLWWSLCCTSSCFQGLCRQTPSQTAFRLRFGLRFGCVPNCGFPARRFPRDRLSAAFSQCCLPAFIRFASPWRRCCSYNMLASPRRIRWPSAGTPPARRGEAPEERGSPWPSPRPRLAPPCRCRSNAPR